MCSWTAEVVMYVLNALTLALVLGVALKVSKWEAGGRERR